MHQLLVARAEIEVLRERIWYLEDERTALQNQIKAAKPWLEPTDVALVERIMEHLQ